VQTIRVNVRPSEAAKAPSKAHTSAEARASLLFDVLEAAKIDREIIYTIGINGLEELR
jgi:hypothetical protein